MSSFTSPSPRLSGNRGLRPLGNLAHDLPSDLGNVVLTAADDIVNVDRPASTVVT